MSQYMRTKIAIAQSHYHTIKPKIVKGESFGATQAKLRPKNYELLSPQEQFDIDRSLGILDWSGA